MNERPEIEYRLECLKLAVQTSGYSLDDGLTKIENSHGSDKILKDAQAYVDFVYTTVN